MDGSGVWEWCVGVVCGSGVWEWCVGVVCGSERCGLRGVG